MGEKCHDSKFMLQTAICVVRGFQVDKKDRCGFHLILSGWLIFIYSCVCYLGASSTSVRTLELTLHILDDVYTKAEKPDGIERLQLFKE